MGELFSLDRIPLLHSNLNTPVKLYLDFNGHFDAVWGGYTNVATPVYDIDGDATIFSQQELDNITEVWHRIAEDFAPFQIDVTTEDPDNFFTGVVMRIAIGGGTFQGSGVTFDVTGMGNVVLRDTTTGVVQVHDVLFRDAGTLSHMNHSLLESRLRSESHGGMMTGDRLSRALCLPHRDGALDSQSASDGFLSSYGAEAA